MIELIQIVYGAGGSHGFISNPFTFGLDFITFHQEENDIENENLVHVESEEVVHGKISHDCVCE